MNYTDLSDEDKLVCAINFVATGQPLPQVLIEFLREHNLFDAVTKPCIIEQEYYVVNVS